MLARHRTRESGGVGRAFAVFLAVVAAVAGFEIWSLVAHNRERASAPTATTAPATAPVSAPVAAGPIGDIDAPTAEAVVGPRITISGGRSTPMGVRTVEIRVDDIRFTATMGVARPDVAQAKPGYAGNATRRLRVHRRLSGLPAAPAPTDGC